MVFSLPQYSVLQRQSIPSSAKVIQEIFVEYMNKIVYFAEVWRDFMDYEPVNFRELFLSPVAFVERYGNDITETEPEEIFGSLKVPC